MVMLQMMRKLAAWAVATSVGVAAVAARDVESVAQQLDSMGLWAASASCVSLVDGETFSYVMEVEAEGESYVMQWAPKGDSSSEHFCFAAYLEGQSFSYEMGRLDVKSCEYAYPQRFPHLTPSGIARELRRAMADAAHCELRVFEGAEQTVVYLRSSGEDETAWVFAPADLRLREVCAYRAADGAVMNVRVQEIAPWIAAGVTVEALRGAYPEAFAGVNVGK